MDIEYKTRKLEKECTDYSVACKAYGPEMAEKIAQRISEIKSASDVELLIRCQIGRCHPLKANRKGEYAMVLVQPYRLVFKQIDSMVHLVRITTIENYH